MLEPTIGFANDYTFVDYFKQHTDVADCCISVVIPYYKRPRELIYCIQRLLDQTHPPKQMQLVVVDDGSDKDTQALDIVNSYADVFYEAVYIYQKDEGYRLSRARNLGVAAARFDYVLILDCDILCCVDLVRQHLRAVSVSPLVVSLGFRVATHLDGSEVLQTNFVETPPMETLDWRIKHLSSSKFSNDVWRLVSGGNVCAHRSLFEQHKFDERFNAWGGEDNEWGYRLWKAGCYFYPNLQACSYHVIAGGFQTDRDAGRSITRPLLKQLCPRFDEDSLKTDGEVPLVSIFITNYNKGVHLEQAVASALAIPYRKEIVVVDNGSTDGSYELAQGLAKQHNCIVLLQEIKRGAYFAFETALAACRGEILIQLDADDVLVKDTTVSLIHIAINTPLGIVFANTQPMSADLLSPLGNAWRWPRCAREDNIVNGMYIRNPRVFKKRDLMRTQKRPFVQAATDFNIYAPLFLVSYGALVDRIGLLYRKLDDSITAQLLPVQKATTLFLLDRNRGLLENGDALQVKDTLNERAYLCEKVKDLPIYYNAHLQVADMLWGSCTDLSNLIDRFVYEIDKAQYKCYMAGTEIDLSDRSLCATISSQLQRDNTLVAQSAMWRLFGLVLLPSEV